MLVFLQADYVRVEKKNKSRGVSIVHEPKDELVYSIQEVAVVGLHDEDERREKCQKHLMEKSVGSNEEQKAKEKMLEAVEKDLKSKQVETWRHSDTDTKMWKEVSKKYCICVVYSCVQFQYICLIQQQEMWPGLPKSLVSRTC